MKNKFITAILVILYCGVAYAASPDTPQKQSLTADQKKEFAMQLGIILPGMTKAEVRKTFGLIEPKIWYTPDGQEVWHYKAPEPQNIYFTNTTVERVEYLPRKSPTRSL
jgi:hypothetical protein